MVNYITPGNGSFTNSAGDVFSVNPVHDEADINGQPITPDGGSTNTGAMELSNDQVFAQDENSGQWFILQPKSPGLWEWQFASPPSSASSSSTPPSSQSSPIPSSSPLSDQFVTPGSGSFADASGNSYSIDLQTNAIENGGYIPGGYGTSEIGLVGGTVYGQDMNSHNWYTWNQSAWSPASAPPGA
jgi:hypothetical protein